MATAEELLNEIVGEQESKTLMVDMNSRTILIPKTVKNIGVESDDDVLRLDFSMPRFYGDVDLFTFEKHINYKNAKNNGDVYRIDDAVVEGDNIIFTWLVGRNAVAFEGNMQFNICFKRYDKVDPTIVIEEFNTTPVTMPVLRGLETSEAVVQQHADILVRWENQLFGIGDTVESRVSSNLEAKGAMVLESIPEDYQTLYKRSDESLRTRANAIVGELEGVVVKATDASNDYLRGLKLFGKSLQDGTPSPDAPVDVTSLGNDGKINIHIHGKNLLNVDKVCVFTQYLKLDTFIPAGEYILSYAGASVDGGSGGACMKFANNDLWISLNGDANTHVVELVKDETAVHFYSNGQSYTNSIDITAIINNLMLSREGGSYEPYTEMIVTANVPDTGLPGIAVTSGGNYTDANGQQWICDEIDFERGVYIQRVLVKTFTDFSSASVYESNNGVTEGYINSYNQLNSSTGMCDRFRYLKTGIEARFAVHGAVVFFSLPGEFTETEWKTQMNAITPTIYVPLETPIETPLMEADLYSYQNARSSYLDTVIMNDAGAWMEVIYNIDTQTYFNNSRGASDEQVDASVRAYADEKGLSVPSDTHIENVVATYITNNPVEALTDAEINSLTNMLK